jgi:hypothetical protein
MGLPVGKLPEVYAEALNWAEENLGRENDEE